MVRRADFSVRPNTTRDRAGMPPRTNVCRDFQENVLGRITEARQIATIYLRNRMSIRGRVLEYDPYVLLLEPLDGGPAQLVYKSAIVSISGPRTLGGGRGPGGGGRGPGGRGPEGPRPPRRHPGEGGERGYPRDGSPRDGERHGNYPPREHYSRENPGRDGFGPRNPSGRDGYADDAGAGSTESPNTSRSERPAGERTFRPPAPE